MKVSSVLATISVNALASMHVTQLGLTGSAGFEDRRNKQGLRPIGSFLSGSRMPHKGDSVIEARRILGVEEHFLDL